MKFNSDSLLLILFILGMVYISCDQNLEGICFGKGCMWMNDPSNSPTPTPTTNKDGICYGNPECMGLDEGDCLENPYNNGKGCMWMNRHRQFTNTYSNNK